MLMVSSSDRDISCVRCSAFAVNFLCPLIDRSGVYCFTSVCLSICLSVHLSAENLTFPKKSPGFHVSAVQVFEKHCGKRRYEQFLLFPQCFQPFGEVSAIFIKLKLSYATFFNSEESKICSLGNC